MTDEIVKRGPGRPRKVAPEGFVVPIASAATVEVEDEAPLPFRRVRVLAYKIWTSQGRGIEGQFLELPSDEADELIASGKVRDARSH